MNELKSYIIRIIAVAAIVQFGVIVSGDKYKKIYSLVGAIFIIFAMLSVPQMNIADISYDSYNREISEYNGKTISEQFTENVSEKIEEDIMTVFEIQADVTVSTDSSYSKICITVECECSDEVKYRIKEYVLKTFCTSNDEVIMISE